jgi:hypothetical protein
MSKQQDVRSSFSAYVGALTAIPGHTGLVGKLVVALGSKNFGARHHALLVDCSYSTYTFNGTIRRDVAGYVEHVPANDKITVIQYSGEGDTRVIFGPETVTEANRLQLAEKVRRRLNLIGNTVFEEPLQQALQAVKEASSQVVGTVVVFFTDGLPEPAHRTREAELQAAEVAADTLENFAEQREDFSAVQGAAAAAGRTAASMSIRRQMQAAEIDRALLNADQQNAINALRTAAEARSQSCT